MKALRYLPRFRAAARAMAELADREEWSRGQIEAWQLERLNRVWRHAIAHVPHYRNLAAQQKLPSRFGSLEEYCQLVPLLPKVAVRARPSDFLSHQPGRGSWRRTGGSTGMPMSIYREHAAHMETLRARYRHHAMWDVDIFDRCAYVWGHSASLAAGWKGRFAKLRRPLEDYLRNRLRLSAYHLGPSDLKEHVRRIQRFAPASLYGYSRALYLLALEAERRQIQIEGLKLVTLTGEPAFPFIVDKVQRVLAAPAVVEYGCIECGDIASEWPDRTLRVREDLTMVETLPREDGRYELVVSVLNNPSFPLLRYAIADVTDGPLEKPDSGFAMLENVSGRHNDFIVTRSGRFLHSARFDALFKYENTAIRRFRVRQRADGSMAVALELEAGQKLDTLALEQKLQELVEGYRVELELVEAIPQTPAGKHRLVMSQLAQGEVSALEPASEVRGQGQAQPCGHGQALEPSATSAASLSSSCGPTLSFGQGEQREQPFKKAARLRQLVQRGQLDFFMEAHNGLSAKVVEEAGFEAIWASGLAISAALGVRDSNEASWTQVLEVLEFMSDATRIPILIDGDTGYGNFNNMRRLVRKLEQRGIGGVCIEDKTFPKTNSFINGAAQPLADVDEFCGRIKAGKDAQGCDDFVLVARVEAFIAGWGLKEALRRAAAYHVAGADAILIHSAQRSADEVLNFKSAWGDRAPVIIVPTKYYATPTQVFRDHDFSAVIWANQLMRCCLTAMQRTALEIYEDQHLHGVEDRIAPLREVFRIQGASELAEAEKRYLPNYESP